MIWEGHDWNVSYVATPLYLICMYHLWHCWLYCDMFILQVIHFWPPQIGKTCSKYLKECKINVKFFFYSKDDIWIFLWFFHFFDKSMTPGGQMQKSIFLKFCTLIDFMIRYKFVIHSVSELWTATMIFGLFFDFSIFLTTLGPWWQNALTNITESLHLDRSHHKLQVCNSLSKLIMNTKDDIWNYLIFCLFQTIWCHLVAKCTNQYNWKLAPG